MIAAIHQPQFLPGLRFFSKMRSSDFFIFLDDVQYEKREFQNRNRIKTASGPIFLTVPVMSKGLFEQKISEVKINQESDWKAEHLKTLKTYYSRSLYFNKYFSELETIYRREHLFLRDLSMETIFFLAKAFNISRPAKNSSEFKLSSSSSLRLAELCALSGADAYLSGAGGRNYLEEIFFQERKIKILWQDFTIKPYPQLYGPFLENLSALDLLFNCGPDSEKYL